MPSYDEDLKNVQELSKKAASATKKAAGYTSDANIFKDLVMTDVQKARAERGISQIAKDSGVAMGQLVTGGQEIRDRVGTSLNPLSVDQYTSKQRGQTLGTIETIGNVLQERAGTIDDIIGQGTNRLTSIANIAQGEAESYGKQANSLMDVVRVKQQQEAQAFSEWLARENLALEQYKASRSGSGGGGSKEFDQTFKSFREDITGLVMDPAVDEGGLHTVLRFAYGDEFLNNPAVAGIVEEARLKKRNILLAPMVEEMKLKNAQFDARNTNLYNQAASELDSSKLPPSVSGMKLPAGSPKL